MEKLIAFICNWFQLSNSYYISVVADWEKNENALKLVCLGASFNKVCFVASKCSLNNFIISLEIINFLGHLSKL